MNPTVDIQLGVNLSERLISIRTPDGVYISVTLEQAKKIAADIKVLLKFARELENRK